MTGDQPLGYIPQPASELVAEVCIAHIDADCKVCDEGDDALWVHPRDLGGCRKCGNRYVRQYSFYDEESLCPRCGDEQEELTDDYTPPPRTYEKCSKCGDDMLLKHHCAPLLRAVIATGIRQYCSDLACEYGHHEPHRDCSILQRVHDDAAQIAAYITDDGLSR